MDSSVSPKDEIWFLRVCHHISTGLYVIRNLSTRWKYVVSFTPLGKNHNIH